MTKRLVNPVFVLISGRQLREEGGWVGIDAVQDEFRRRYLRGYHEEERLFLPQSLTEAAKISTEGGSPFHPKEKVICIPTIGSHDAHGRYWTITREAAAWQSTNCPGGNLWSQHDGQPDIWFLGVRRTD